MPGDVALRVRIDDFTDVLPTDSHHLFVHLLGCTRFDLATWDGDPVDSLCRVGWPDDDAIADLPSAKEVDGVVGVACLNGFLHTTYRDVEILFPDGRPLPIETLDAAAAWYWSEWERTGKKAADRRRNDAVG